MTNMLLYHSFLMFETMHIRYNKCVEFSAIHFKNVNIPVSLSSHCHFHSVSCLNWQRQVTPLQLELSEHTESILYLIVAKVLISLYSYILIWIHLIHLEKSIVKIVNKSKRLTSHGNEYARESVKHTCILQLMTKYMDIFAFPSFFNI